jgi:hypothetical protein
MEEIVGKGKKADLVKPNYTINNHQIDNFDTFTRVTNEPIAGLYFYSTLDCLVDLAYAITRDFFDRPHLYTDLGGIAPKMAKLNVRYGKDERLLSKEQRKLIFSSVFGEAKGPLDDRGDFYRLKHELIDAATAFSERVYDTGEDMLRERVRTAHRPFKEYLSGLFGDSIRWSKEESLAWLTEEVCYPILRQGKVASIFGIARAPRANWPYTEDANADKLVEELAKRFKGSNGTIIPLTREYFSNLQRTALRGAEALATIIEYKETDTTIDDLNRLILKCYSWGSALKSIHRPMMQED